MNASRISAAETFGSDIPLCIKSKTVLPVSPAYWDMPFISLPAAFTFIVTCLPGEPSGITEEIVVIQRSRSSSVRGSRVAFSSNGYALSITSMNAPSC